MINWRYAPDNINDYVGFVYKIIEKDTNKFYYGLKNYWSVTKRKPNKFKMIDGKFVYKKGKRILETRTTKKHIKVETDWRNYNSSSLVLQKKIEENPNNYEKLIIRNCKSKSELKGYEAYIILKEYFEGDWENCFNECVELRLKLKKLSS